ncbi:MAG TPA: DUF2251 domain-containing protein [Acidobacteriaceae bacterium]|jgi:hypothetical protein|nr:DUF2251 domain-containing protein [Acidobacteriaceae bacterium]
MDSLTFTPGRAFLSSNSPAVPWTAVFEDEGAAGYLYACDRSWQTQQESILDAMLIYNVASLEAPTRERLASVQWSRDGQQAVFYLDGTAQAFLDFAARQSFCRSNFPNFMEQHSDRWRRSTHAWDEEALKRFEAALYS